MLVDLKTLEVGCSSGRWGREERRWAPGAGPGRSAPKCAPGSFSTSIITRFQNLRHFVNSNTCISLHVPLTSWRSLRSSGCSSPGVNSDRSSLNTLNTMIFRMNCQMKNVMIRWYLCVPLGYLKVSLKFAHLWRFEDPNIITITINIITITMVPQQI